MEVKQILAILQEERPDIYVNVTTDGNADAGKIRAQAYNHGIPGSTVLFILTRILQNARSVLETVPETEPMPEPVPQLEQPEPVPHLVQPEPVPEPLPEPPSVPEPDWNLAQDFLEQCQLNYGDALQAQQSAEQAIGYLKDALRDQVEFDVSHVAHGDDDDIATILNQLQWASIR